MHAENNDFLVNMMCSLWSSWKKDDHKLKMIPKNWYMVVYLILCMWVCVCVSLCVCGCVCVSVCVCVPDTVGLFQITARRAVWVSTVHGGRDVPARPPEASSWSPAMGPSLPPWAPTSPSLFSWNRWDSYLSDYFSRRVCDLCMNVSDARDFNDVSKVNWLKLN